MHGNDDVNFLSPKPKRASTCLYIVLQSQGKSRVSYATRDEAESGAFHLATRHVQPKSGLATARARFG
jgi:hypothetical protein